MSKSRELARSDEQTPPEKGPAHKPASDSESRFRNTMKQAPVGIAILRGENFLVEMANDTYLRIVDRTEEEMVGRPLFQSIPEVQDVVAPVLKTVLDTGVPYHGNEFEVTLRRFGQPQTAYFNFVYQPLIEGENTTEVSGVIVVATEVTQQVTSRQALQRSENQFRNLVMQSQFAKAIFKSRDFTISLANETMLKIWRRKEQEVVGKKLFEVFPELQEQHFFDILNNVYDTGIIHRETEAMVYLGGPDGVRNYYLDVQCAPISELDGSISGIMVSVNNATDKVKFRQQIADAAERLSLATEGTRLATWDLNLKTRQIIYSARLPVIFGYEETAVLTHYELRDHVHPDDRETILEPAFEEALETGIYQYEARIIHPDKSVHWIRTQGKILFSNGVPGRMLGTMMDITSQKEAELALKTSEEKFRTLADQLETNVQQRTRELTIANNELVRTNMELAQFAYVASHDLQEPLRKIQTFATRILETEHANLSERGRDYFNRMRASSTRMQQLIVDLLAFSRANAVEKHFELTDLNMVLQSVKDQLSDVILQKNAVINSEVLPMREVIVYQIEQLFMNIIANALKFTKPQEQPVITISTGKVAGQLLTIPDADPQATYEYVSISDNGIGFEQEFKDRIFQVFQRLHTRSTYEGTGIGLAICKKIVDNHRGLIDAIGRPGVGSTFVIYLPV